MKPQRRPEIRSAAWLVLVVLCCGRASGVAAQEPNWSANLAAFRTELSDLQDRLGIAGMAYAIVEDGDVIQTGASGVRAPDDSEPFTSATPLDIQSITKSMVAVVAMQLVEVDLLDLDASVSTLLTEVELPSEVRVRHLLSHTSEGIVGREYVYSPERYGLLGRIIAQVTGGTLEQALRRRVVEAADMTWHDSPGLGAATGLVSTVDDLARYVQALDRGALLGDAALRRLATPSISTTGQPLPTSLGWFAQSIQGVPVMWGYGQSGDQGAGVLLFRVPDRRLTLVVLANNNLISDRFRLLAGDVSKSSFAMTFYRLFVASPPGQALRRPDWASDDLIAELRALEQDTDYRYEGELVGQVLIRQFHGQPGEADALFDVAMRYYDVASRPEPVVHFAILTLPPGPVKQVGIDMGTQLLADHPDNRWILLFQGYLLQQTGRGVEAAVVFNRILSLPNQHQGFLLRLFNAWSWYQLADIHRADDPDLARRYLRRIIDSGVGGADQRRAETMLAELEAA